MGSNPLGSRKFSDDKYAWVEFKVDKEAFDDRQWHKVCILSHENKAIQTHGHNSFAAASMCLGCLVLLKSA